VFYLGSRKQHSLCVSQTLTEQQVDRHGHYTEICTRSIYSKRGTESLLLSLIKTHLTVLT